MVTINICSCCGTPKIASPVSILSGDVDPEGSVVAMPLTFYWNRQTKKLWIKDVGNDNTGWEELI